MLAPWFRVALCTALAAAAAIQLWRRDSSGWLLLVSAALFLDGFYRYGSVGLAFRAYQLGDFARMSKHLVGSDPRRLNKQHAAYFRFLKAVEAQVAGDHARARDLLEPAVIESLRTAKMRAIARLHLAESEFGAGNVKAAQVLVAEVRAASTDPRVLELAAQLDARTPATGPGTGSSV
jgi:hypothetical protein